MKNVIFIHGLESSGKGFKGRFFKNRIPGILTPSFKEFDSQILMYDLLDFRMNELRSILNRETSKDSWVIIGSSFGGLMGAIYTLERPKKVNRLILLAPLLASRKIKLNYYKPINIPVIIYHGINDKVVPYGPSKERAKLFFTNLEYNLVKDDHMLHSTVLELNWEELIQ